MPVCIACEAPMDGAESVYLGKVPIAGYLESHRSAARGAPTFPLVLACCPSCGLTQQGDQSVAAFDLLTRRVYGQYHATYSASSSVPVLLAQFLRLALDASAGSAESLAVDVGSNDGTALRLLTAAGLTAVGFEPSLHLARRCRSEGLDVKDDLFDQDSARLLRSERGAARLVVARHTLEHAFDPTSFLRAAASLCAADGRVVVEVPYLPAQVAAGHVEGIGHQHRSFFDVRALANVMGMAGLTMVESQFIGSDGGSVIAVAVPSQALRSSHTDRVRRLIGWESSFSINVLSRLRADLTRLQRDVAALSTILGPQGLLVAYGAGSKGQLLLNLLATPAFDVGMAVDETPDNASRFVPGVGTPVVGVSEARLREASLALITAPTHIVEARQKLTELMPSCPVMCTVPQLRLI